MNRRARTTRRLRLGRPRLEQLLPLACLIAAAALFASEFFTTFEFIGPGQEPVAEQGGGERHGYALALIAAFAFAATLGAVLAGSKPAATAVGALGVVALLFFLIVDVPDAGTVGTLEEETQSFFDAEAVPRIGFWLALVGSLGLAVSGVALATLSVDQLAALRPRWASPDRSSEAPGPPGPEAGSSAPGPEASRSSTNSHGRGEAIAPLPRGGAPGGEPDRPSRRGRRREHT